VKEETFMSALKKFSVFTFSMVLTALLCGCTTINDATGGGAGSGKICVTVDTDEKGPVTLDIQAVGIGGPNALTKFTGTVTATGPFKGTQVCTNALPGDPELQKWEVKVTVSKGGKAIKEKTFGPQTYKY
jgi:hypothetical protein